jgi:hypothetical protein
LKPLKQLPLVAALGLLAFLAPLAEAATIQFVGVYNDLGSRWRTPAIQKTFDPDGDNIIGTDGYHVINIPLVWPSYLTSTENLTNTLSLNGDHGSMDQPTGLPGLILTGAIKASPGSEISADLLRFTFGPTVVGRAVRVALLVDNLDDSGFNARSISLVQTAGGNSVSGPVPTDSAPLNNRTIDWIVFEITGANPGDAFVVRGLGGARGTAALGGVAFDSTAQFGSSLELTQQAIINTTGLIPNPVSIAVSGDTLVAGTSAPRQVLVMVRNGTNWVQQAVLQPHNASDTDGFGRSVAISGDTLIVGAPDEDSIANGINLDLGGDNSSTDSGAAYVFVRTGTNWTQQAYIKASDNQPGLRFGGSVAISGDSAVVGVGALNWLHATATPTVQWPSTANNGVGAAYAFSRKGTQWSQEARLIPDSGDPGDGFGLSVAISEETIVVGAPFEDGPATRVDGDEQADGNPGAGAAFVFARKAGAWQQQAYLKAANNDAGNAGRASHGDRFGWQVAISGNTTLIGAPLEDSFGLSNNNWATNNGAAYTFIRSQERWSQQAMLKAVDREHAAFGATVALSGDRALVGDIFGGSSLLPSTFVFERHGTSWIRQATLVGSEAGGPSVPPGMIALSGGTAVIKNQANLFVFSTDAPRMTIEDSTGTLLAPGTTEQTMAIQDGLDDELTFTLRNTGTVTLSNIVASLVAPQASRFQISAAPSDSLPPGGSSTLTLRFVEGPDATPAVATLRLASSDPARSPWILNLLGIRLVSSSDSDADGLNDVAEFRLRSLGFDPFARQPSLVKALNLGGVYGLSQIQALHVGKPLLHPIAPGVFRLTLGLQKATQLTNFAPFPMTAPQTVINSQGQLEFEFTSPDNAAFYRLDVE